MFAGAAREAVFSNPDVIRRVHADFVPVALKAALVNNPPGDEEGLLYREVGRSKPAPQGICVVNPAGKVLDWVLMFDGEESILAFFDHVLKRFAQYPDAKRPVPAERYMKFPSAKLEDVADSGQVLPAVERHSEGKRCPAQPRLRPGTVVARLFGRALDKDGKPVADAVRQEHYVEDRFEVPVETQKRLTRALSDAGAGRFRLPDDFARLLVNHAYLGQLDVNPLGSPAGGSGSLKHCEFWGQRSAADGGGPVQVRIEGRSEVAGAQDAGGRGPRGDGRLWEHEVQLTWRGLIEVRGDRVSRLLLAASGSEKLRWSNRFGGLKGEVDVAHLPAGHPIDLACGVRYGILGEPAAADQVGDPDVSPPSPGGAEDEVPAEARRQLLESFGPPFLIFHAKVQEELRLSADQKRQVEERLREHLQAARQFFAKLEELKPEEREKELHTYRQQAQEQLGAFVQATFKDDQFQRLRQLLLRREGLFALGNPEVAAALKLTDEQCRQFVAVVQGMQKKLEPLLKEAHSKGNHDEVRPRALKIRDEHERQLAALLTAAQQKRWGELLGKPFDLGE